MWHAAATLSSNGSGRYSWLGNGLLSRITTVSMRQSETLGNHNGTLYGSGVAERKRESANVRLGLNVRTLRERKGWSQDELAATMRERGHPWHGQTVGKVERGEQPVRWPEAESLAQLLGTSLDRLTWNSEEASAAEFLYARSASLRRSGHAVAEAVMRLLADRAGAQQAAGQMAADERGHVAEAREDLLAAMAEWDLEGAVAEGEAKYEELREQA